MLIVLKQKIAHSKPLFRKLNLHDFEECYKILSAKFIFDVVQKKIDTTLSGLFKSVSSVHSICTRKATSGFLSQPTVRANFKKMFMINLGIKTQNIIPLEIKQPKHNIILSRS